MMTEEKVHLEKLRTSEVLQNGASTCESKDVDGNTVNCANCEAKGTKTERVI